MRETSKAKRRSKDASCESHLYRIKVIYQKQKGIFNDRFTIRKDKEAYNASLMGVNFNFPTPFTTSRIHNKPIVSLDVKS